MYKHSVAPLGKGKSLDVFRPAFDIAGEPVDLSSRERLVERINITFRHYRRDFHPCTKGKTRGTPTCRCGIPA